MPNAIARSCNFANAALLCAIVGALLPVASHAASKTLTISGTPATTVSVNGKYSFQPAAKDTVKSRIKFDVYNKPSWASFDGETGRLSGTPNRNQVGTYKNITIRLTDWYGFVTTKPFSITVVASTKLVIPSPTPLNPAPVKPVPVSSPPVKPVPVSSPPTISAANVTLDWTPPTENTDGSVLSNLAGYKVTYGTDPSHLTQVIKVANAGLSSLVVDDLAPGTWYFSVISYNDQGVESLHSAVVSTKIL